MSKNKIRIRKDSEIWLLGFPISEIKGCKLPSINVVLRNFFFHHETKTIHESARQTFDNVLTFWNKARIPTSEKQNAVKRLEKLVERYQKLKKNRKRRTNIQEINEQMFISECKMLWDISHENALQMIKLEEDKKFLLQQREGLQGCMLSVDRKLENKEKRSYKRKRYETLPLDNVDKSQTECYLSCSNVEEDGGSISSSLESDADDDTFNYPSTSTLKKKADKKRKIKLNSPNLMSALDRTKISDRSATFAIAATAQTVGINMSEITLSRSTLRRQRAEFRAQFSMDLKHNFDPDGPLVVHWDGKLLADISGEKVEVDRLPILVTGNDVEKLLGVPKLPVGTGKAIAKAVFDTLNDWKITHKIQGMCFDTTSCNTGIHIGACKLLEQKIGKQLLSLACRHHIYEIVVGDVFSVVFGPSSGPCVLMFKRFQSQWNFIDKSSFKCPEQTIELSENWKKLKENAIEFAKHYLTVESKTLPRNDYREFLELTLIYLGEVPPRGVNFAAPGAFHHARWMAKVIYCLKIYMFRKQFKLTPKEAKGLERFNDFSTRLYMKVWFCCSNAADAPFMDLEFLKHLDLVKNECKEISEAASKALKRHLWYLNGDLVMLCLFSSNVSTEDKILMVDELFKIDKYNRERVTNASKRLSEQEIGKVHEKSLHNFVNKNSWRIFEALNIQDDFLHSSPSEWKKFESYRDGERKVKCLKIINDCAERGVALISEYNQLITKDEEQKQFLLQVVEAHRKKFKDTKKITLVNNM